MHALKIVRNAKVLIHVISVHQDILKCRVNSLILVIMQFKRHVGHIVSQILKVVLQVHSIHNNTRLVYVVLKVVQLVIHRVNAIRHVQTNAVTVYHRLQTAPNVHQVKF
jgi:hypothetical protein